MSATWKDGMGKDPEQTRTRIIEAAGAMLSGQLDLVTGCRRLTSLSHEVPRSERQLFIPFIGFDSETDGYPVGEVRREYAPAYLDQLDREISEHSEKCRPEILDACRAILARFGRGQ